MAESYNTLVEALNALRTQGYTEDLNLMEHCLVCKGKDFEIVASEFEVDKVFRFEGDSNPSDSSVVYAISSDTYSIKGVLVDAYGVYSGTVSTEIIEKLSWRP